MRTLKKSLCLLLSIVMVLGLVAVNVSASTFPDDADVSEDYQEAVDVLQAIKVFVGDDAGKLNPTESLTRVQGAILVTRLMGWDETELTASATPFTDIPTWDGAAQAISLLYSEKITDGISDTEFGSNLALTGTAFAKWLLCALGYDMEAEGLTGESWEINASKLAKSSGVAGDIMSAVTNKAITREVAGQLAFNTLLSDTVTYSSTIKVGDVTVTGTRSEVPGTKASDYRGSANGDDVLQLCEQNFPKLKADVTGATADDFGRPITTIWTNNGTVVYDEPSVAVATFTDGMTAAKVATELTGYYLKDTTGAVHAVNNVATATAYATAADIVTTTDYSTNTAWTTSSAALSVAATKTNAAAINALTGDGKLVEVYADSEGVITDIVVTEYKVATVGTISTASTGTTYTIDGSTYTDYTSATATDTIETKATLAKNDVVTYTVAKNVAGTAIAYVYATTSVSGTQTSYTANSKGEVSKLVMDGETYYPTEDVAGVDIKASAFTTNGNRTYSIDQYGYVVASKAGDSTAAASTNYAYILSTGYNLSGALDKEPTIEVRAVLSNGTVGTYKLALSQVASTTDNVYGKTQIVGASQLAATGDDAGGQTTFEVGDWYIKGTETYTSGASDYNPIMVMNYDWNKTTSALETALDAELAYIRTAIGSTAGQSNIWGYTLDGDVMTLERLEYVPATGTATENNTVYGTTMTGAISYNATSSKAVATASSTATDKTVLFNSSTVYVVYNPDTKAATTYTGISSLPQSVSSKTGYVVFKTGTAADRGTAAVVFISANDVEADTPDNYAYVAASSYSTTVVDGKTLYGYTAVLPGGGTETLYKASPLASSAAGLYPYNPDTKLLGVQVANSTATFSGSFYSYANDLAVNDDQIRVNGAWYNVTEDTLVYVASGAKLDGGAGYVVLAPKADGTPSDNIAAYFVLGTGTGAVVLDTVTETAIESALASSDVTINANVDMAAVGFGGDSNLQIPEGKTLTINGAFTMANDDTITLAKNAKLIVNNSTTTGTTANAVIGMISLGEGATLELNASTSGTGTVTNTLGDSNSTTITFGEGSTITMTASSSSSGNVENVVKGTANNASVEDITFTMQAKATTGTAKNTIDNSSTQTIAFGEGATVSITAETSVGSSATVAAGAVTNSLVPQTALDFGDKSTVTVKATSTSASVNASYGAGNVLNTVGYASGTALDFGEDSTVTITASSTNTATSAATGVAGTAGNVINDTNGVDGAATVTLSAISTVEGAANAATRGKAATNGIAALLKGTYNVSTTGKNASNLTTLGNTSKGVTVNVAGNLTLAATNTLAGTVSATSTDAKVATTNTVALTGSLDVASTLNNAEDSASAFTPGGLVTLTGTLTVAGEVDNTTNGITLSGTTPKLEVGSFKVLGEAAAALFKNITNVADGIITVNDAVTAPDLASGTVSITNGTWNFEGLFTTDAAAGSGTGTVTITSAKANFNGGVVFGAKNTLLPGDDADAAQVYFGGTTKVLADESKLCSTGTTGYESGTDLIGKTLVSAGTTVWNPKTAS